VEIVTGLEPRSSRETSPTLAVTQTFLLPCTAVRTCEEVVAWVAPATQPPPVGGGVGSDSTVQLRVAGLKSTLPALSVARTVKVCAATERPE
jgi:hypothetical protein